MVMVAVVIVLETVWVVVVAVVVAVQLVAVVVTVTVLVVEDCVVVEVVVEVREVELVVVVVSVVPVDVTVLVVVDVVVCVAVVDTVDRPSRLMHANPDMTLAFGTSFGWSFCLIAFSQHLSVKPCMWRAFPQVHASHPGAARQMARQISALLTCDRVLRFRPVT
mmetsp:Transcript_95849/g.222197  ORF Transcript_95849/g.222197 Transcript_95849/m.222197 type:complete len:164 (+) Transcript_95849:1413-1904(+)